MEIVLLGFGQIGRTLATLIGRVRRPGALAQGGGGDRPQRVRVRSAGPRAPAGSPRSPRTSERVAALAEAPRGRPGTGGGGHRPHRRLRAHPAGRWWTSPPTTPAPRSRRRSPTAWTSCWPTSGRSPGAAPASESLWQTARARGRRILHEATVGAGLPIIDTYHKLTESGDRVERIEGLLSGTLGYVLSEVGDGVPFSRAVRSAMRLGYTEPDPREDLSGMDVGRKALILARLLGYRGELSRQAVESLVPKWARALPLAQFLERLGELDAPWKRRVDAARAQGTRAALRRDGHARQDRGRAQVGAARRARSPRSRARTTSSCSPPRATRRTRWSSAAPAPAPKSPRPACSTTSSGWRARERATRSRRSRRAASATSGPGSTSSASPWPATATRCGPSGCRSRASGCSIPGIPSCRARRSGTPSGLAARAVLERAGAGVDRAAAASGSRCGRDCRSRAARAAARPRRSRARSR